MCNCSEGREETNDHIHTVMFLYYYYFDGFFDEYEFASRGACGKSRHRIWSHQGHSRRDGVKRLDGREKQN